MITHLIEATNGTNWGKFLLARFDTEWAKESRLGDVSDIGAAVMRKSLLAQLGWTTRHLWVLDLQTGEGAFFRPGGHAANDLDKHKVWVCPMYEPFLTWLYTQDTSDITALPAAVRVESASALSGYRRPGH